MATDNYLWDKYKKDIYIEANLHKTPIYKTPIILITFDNI